MAKRKRASLVGTGAAAVGLAQSEMAQEILTVSPTEVVFINDIDSRAQGDTRNLSALAVLELAESISILGLLEPVVTDKKNKLLAGGHRLAACKLLQEEDIDKRTEIYKNEIGFDPLKEERDLLKKLDSASFLEHHPKGKIPVRVVNIDSKKETAIALEIEIAENEKRKDYTKNEIIKVMDRLSEAGFEWSRGRPKKGSKPMMPQLQRIFGKSIRQVQRMLYTKSPTDVALTPENKLDKKLHSFLKSIESFEKFLQNSNDGKDLQKSISQELESITMKLKSTLSK